MIFGEDNSPLVTSMQHFLNIQLVNKPICVVEHQRIQDVFTSKTYVLDVIMLPRPPGYGGYLLEYEGI